MTTEIVYIDRDNEIKFELLSDDVALTSSQMASITRVKVKYDGDYYDSVDYPILFDWVTYAADGVLGIKMGTMTGLEAGVDRYTELIIYDAVNTNGVVWTTFRLKVLADAEE